MVFVEDPWSRIVGVHWDDRPPDPPDPGEVDGVCGQILLQGGSEPGYGGAGIMVLKSNGVWLVARNDLPDQPPDQPYMLLNGLAAYHYEPRNTLVWNTASSFTVSFGPTPPPTQFRLNEYRNINIQRFAGLSDWSAYPPDQQITLPGSMIIRSQLPGEIYPPFYTLEYSFYTFWDRHNFPGGGIQAHCEHETTGGLPPQPPAYILDIKQQLPGSSSDPVIPPEGARLSTRRNRIRRWT